MAVEAKKIEVAEVVRHGDKIVLPQNMEASAAIKILEAKAREEEEFTVFRRTLPVTPYDGAYCLSLAMEEMFGLVVQRSGFFTPRQKVQVVVDHTGATIEVAWGSFKLPNIDGTIQTSYTWDDGRVLSELKAEVKGKHSLQVTKLFDLAYEYAKTRSLYKNRAMQVRFTDNDGNALPLPDIKFVDLERAAPPIFADAIQEKLDYDLLAYIRLPEEVVLEIAGELRRGVLLAGPYGSGKTMLSGYVGKEAVQAGFTFFYVQPQDAEAAVRLAYQYEPSVVFIEDLDKLNEDEQRALMNVLDGITSKRRRIISIFTTNHHDKLIQGLVRNGRIDLALHIDYPDATAAIRIAALYANGHMDEADDFAQAGKQMAGTNPAQIREIVNRAKMRAAARAKERNQTTYLINNADMYGASLSVLDERDFLHPKQEQTTPDVVVAMREFGDQVGQHLENSLNKNAMPDGVK